MCRCTKRPKRCSGFSIKNRRNVLQISSNRSPFLRSAGFNLLWENHQAWFAPCFFFVVKICRLFFRWKVEMGEEIWSKNNFLSWLCLCFCWFQQNYNHTCRAHPCSAIPRSPTMKGIPDYSLLVKVARGVFQRCVETTLDWWIFTDSIPW